MRDHKRGRYRGERLPAVTAEEAAAIVLIALVTVLSVVMVAVQVGKAVQP